MRLRTLLPAVLLGAASGCASPEIEVVFVQLNDVYEIGSPGETSALARVAWLVQELRSRGDSVIPVIAGDFVSPSALGTARENGAPLAGAQMVDILNRIGIRYAAVGNHEFDLDSAAFYRRAGESRFPWIAANLNRDGDPPPAPIVAWDTLRIRRDGRDVVIGLVGVTLAHGDGRHHYLDTADPGLALAAALPAVREASDVQVALTHLSADQDLELARRFPELAIVMGGHEHNQMDLRVAPSYPRVTKADANARTVWVHRLRYNRLGGRRVVESRLDTVARLAGFDTLVQHRVDSWFERGFTAFREAGFLPEDTVGVVAEELDGLEGSVRSGPTALTRLIARAMVRCAPGARLAVFNSGGIRIDDVIHPGPVLQYDVLRILPFGGEVWEVRVPGRELAGLLSRGRERAGSGGFLQVSDGVVDAGGTWTVGGAPLQPDDTLTIAVNDYLARGGDGLGFRVDSAGVRRVAARGDLRHALIAQIGNDTSSSACQGRPPA